MTIEEKVLAFMIQQNEMGYLPINDKTVTAITNLINEMVVEARGDHVCCKDLDK